MPKRLFLSCSLFLGLFWIFSSPAFGQERPGIDCGCKKVDEFRDPVKCFVPEFTYFSKNNSVDSKYHVTIADTDTPPRRSVSVEKIRDSYRIILPLANRPKGHWGFSPDEDRFYYHYISNNVHHFELYDLSAENQTPIRVFNTYIGDASIAFSPHGNYLVYSVVTSATSMALNIVDARTGSIRFNRETITFTSGLDPSPDDGKTTKLGGRVSGGFAPDDGYKDPATGRTIFSDAVFFYIAVTGDQQAEWNLINLLSPANPNLPVRTKDDVYGGTSWSFSRCGNAVVLQSGLLGREFSLQHPEWCPARGHHPSARRPHSAKHPRIPRIF